jgi:hypothetical protein
MEKYRVRVFGNRVLIKVFRESWNNVVGDSRKLHKEELHNFYSSPNIIRTIKSRR